MKKITLIKKPSIKHLTIAGIILLIGFCLFFLWKGESNSLQSESPVIAGVIFEGEYKIGDTVMYEQGCCCDVTKQHYADGRLTSSQKEGFVYLCQDCDGNLVRDHSKLIELN